ncbi:hypothetical protein HGA91_05990 [candidate division WWE3 bacterium]|nr:hypothetical protein [candidate division WWE3 bacterium]
MEKYVTPTVLYRLPRVVSIILSYIVFAFLIALTRDDATMPKIIGAIAGIAVTAGIIWYTKKQQNNQLYTLLPLGLWFGLLVCFMTGGFTPTISFIRFLFLSILTGTMTALSYYAWQYNQIGGLTYVGLGLFYFFLAVSKVGLLSLFFSVGLFIITGGTYYYQEYLQAKIKPKTPSSIPNQQVSQQ